MVGLIVEHGMKPSPNAIFLIDDGEDAAGVGFTATTAPL